MTRRLIVLALATVTSAVARSQPPQFRATAHAVLVDVAVTDHKRSVPSLKADDFALNDSGVAQRVTRLSIGNLPLDVTLLVDVSYSIEHVDGSLYAFPRHPPAGAWVTSGATQVARLLTPADRLQMIAFSTDIREWSPKQRALTFAPIGQSDAVSGRTALFDAIVVALIQPTPPDRRHVIVALTDGLDSASAIHRSIAAEVLDRADGILYIVACGSREKGFGARPKARDDANFPVAPSSGNGNENWAYPFGGYDWILEDLTDRTGGRFYASNTEGDFVQALNDALAEFRARYVLIYEPQGVPMSGWHPLTITVPGFPKYEVRARRGYFAQ